MKNWEIKRFCFFTSPEYEESMGLGGLEHSTNTLAQMKKWLLKNISNDEIVYEWWQIDDLKKGLTVMTHDDPNPFVETLFQIKAQAHLKLVERTERKAAEKRAWQKNPERLPK